jgi:hypothetical protein
MVSMPGIGQTFRRLVLLAVLLASDGSVVAAQSEKSKTPKCSDAHLSLLRRSVPEGFAIYEKLKEKKLFTTWFKCDDAQLDLTTAVHEGVHILSHEIDAYPLINGQTAALVADLKALFRPGLVAPRYKADNTFVSTYLLPGQATSADQFGYLLNELNAYTHDLNAAVKLRRLSREEYDVFHRDGLAALMSFTAAYVERARADDKTTWSALQSPEVRRTVTTLWAQAEDVMGASCRVPRYAMDAAEFLAPVCAANIRHGLGALLGRPPLCPVSCLRTTAAAP